MTIFPIVRKMLDERDGSHILLTGGGIIPEEDREKLYEIGIGRLFGPGTHTGDIIRYIKDAVGRARDEADVS